LPVAVTSTLMSFIATIAFFGIAGPLAIAFGAGRSLGTKGHVLGLSLYDMFLGSLGVVGAIGAVLVTIIVFPRFVANLIHRVAVFAGRRSRRVAERLDRLTGGIEEAHESVVAFNSLRGWIALGWATLLSGPSHANKLLAGYVALRTIGIEVNFV